MRFCKLCEKKITDDFAPAIISTGGLPIRGAVAQLCWPCFYKVLMEFKDGGRRLAKGGWMRTKLKGGKLKIEGRPPPTKEDVRPPPRVKRAKPPVTETSEPCAVCGKPSTRNLVGRWLCEECLGTAW